MDHSAPDVEIWRDLWVGCRFVTMRRICWADLELAGWRQVVLCFCRKSEAEEFPSQMAFARSGEGRYLQETGMSSTSSQKHVSGWVTAEHESMVMLITTSLHSPFRQATSWNLFQGILYVCHSALGCGAAQLVASHYVWPCCLESGPT